MEQHFGKVPEVPFSEALIRYAKARKRDNPLSFRRSARYRLRILQDWFGDYDLSQITFGLVQEFMDERMGDVTRSTAQHDVSMLRAILNKAQREGLLDKCPQMPKFKSIPSRTRWLTGEEEARLIDASAPHIVPLIIIAVTTGGRLSELLRLDWRDVDLLNECITFVETKNGENRTIRASEPTVKALNSLSPKSSGPVFTFRGKPIVSVKTAFNKARSRAGLDDVRFHDLRHTFASRLVQGGIPLYEVMHLTGHKTLEMVQRYAHLAPDYQSNAINVLNSFGHNLGTLIAPLGGSDAKSLKTNVHP